MRGTGPLLDAVVLRYALGGDANLTHEPIDLEAQRAGFGGRRYWLRCPRCHSRRAKVYLPPGERRFACRDCHDLTYTSVQEHDARIDRLRRDPEALIRTLENPSFRVASLGVLAEIRGPMLCARVRSRRGSG